MTQNKAIPTMPNQIFIELKSLWRDKSGLALIEFAYSLPIFLGLGMYGSEVAYLTLQKTALAQTTVSVADNASRMGATLNDDVSKTIFEADIAQLVAGAEIQAGSLGLLENGRIIISSLEQDADGNQQIAWQRCKGAKNVASKYGAEGKNGTTDPSFIGMGNAGNEIQATSRDAVMFVEVTYTHQPIFGDMFLESFTIYEEAAFNVRDSRDLDAGLVADGTPKADCNVFSAT